MGSHAEVLKDFPILNTKIGSGADLVYLDSAATTLKPTIVADTVRRHYELEASNVHRGVHFLSEQATVAYENTRSLVQTFIGAQSSKEIIFTSGTTASINLVARSYGDHFLKRDDEIIITHMEHHSNIVPWQQLCERVGCKLRVAPINEAGELDLAAFHGLVNERTKIISFVYVSNSLGTINPAKEIVAAAKKVGAITLVDGAQAVAHLPVDVQDLECDFFVFSGHKLFGPTGVGVLWGRETLLEKMPPFLGGGDMIRSVTFAKTTYAGLPAKFEAGTPHIAGVIGLGAAIDYVNGLGFDFIEAHEKSLLDYGTALLKERKGLSLIGTAREKMAVLSFTLDDVHPHDIGSLLDQEGVAIRTGHHCCQPVMERYKVPATARISLSIYNTPRDLDTAVSALAKVQEMFQ